MSEETVSPEGAGPEPEAETGAPGPADFDALRAALPDELRTSPALAPYTSFEGLARSHVEAQRMIGKRIEDASPEELARFHARHGRPARPEDYAFPSDDGGEEPDGTETGAELEQAARAWFFDAGLTQHQAELLYGRWSDFAAGQANTVAEAATQDRAAAEQALRRDWGAGYDDRVAAASRAVAAFGGEGLAAWLEESGLGNDPRLVRAFARIAELTGEDSLVGAGQGVGEGAGFAMAPDAARAEIAKMMANPAYFDDRHPEHAATVERMRTLFAAAYPDAA